MTIHLKRKTLFVDQPISETTPKSVRRARARTHTHTKLKSAKIRDTTASKIHTIKKMLDETENT
jgi:hypothetical protein